MNRLKSKRTFPDELKLIARGVKLSFKVWGKGLKWQIAQKITNLLLPYFALYMSSLIVTELSEVLLNGNSGTDVKRLFVLAAVTVFGSFFLSVVSRIIQGRVNVHLSDSYRRDTLYYLTSQNRMQYDHLENPEVTLLREHIWQAKNATGHGLQRIFWNFPILLETVFDIIVSAALTFTLFRRVSGAEFSGFFAFVNSPVSALAMLLLVGAGIAVKVIYGNYSSRLINASLGTLSKSNATAFALMNNFDKNDTPIFGIQKLILRELSRSFTKADWLITSHRYRLRSNLLNVLMDSLILLFLLLFITAKAYIGAIGIGSFILYIGTVQKFTAAFSSFVEIMGTMLENNNTLSMLFEFLDQPSDMYRGSLAVEKREDNNFEIEFKNVSFKYPGSENYALKNVSAKIDIGKKLAIVGENGSGKTTFIKLLCRLYDPTEGTILLNGIDISRYKYDEYLDLFSVVFQDYRLFAFSVAENISANLDYDRERTEEVLRKVGLGEFLSKLPKGVETAITRDYEHDGVDVSGGEAQKIALARALYKDAPFLVLDEPTAALDPLAEAEIYSKFNEIAGAKTAVYISHRLSSCRFCDDIMVFENGGIVQQGCHDELISDSGGKYFELWNAQAKYYKKEN